MMMPPGRGVAGARDVVVVGDDDGPERARRAMGGSVARRVARAVVTRTNVLQAWPHKTPPKRAPNMARRGMWPTERVYPDTHDIMGLEGGGIGCIHMYTSILGW